MTDGSAENRAGTARSQPVLRVVQDAENGAYTLSPRARETRDASGQSADQVSLKAALDGAEERAQAVASRIAELQVELRLVRDELARRETDRHVLPHAGFALRLAVAGLSIGLLGLALWARAVDYGLRVTSDAPTFITLVNDMAARPFSSQSPFLENGAATQHATPYIQALASLWKGVGGASDPVAVGRYLALAGIVVFAFALWCVFLYVRRLAGSTAAWGSIPVLLGVFGPPHVIWASDLSLHGALYAGYFPQTLAIGTTLLALLALERRSHRSLAAACVLTAATMVVHPFTGVLLAVLATADAVRLAAHRDRACLRAPTALVLGFLAGSLWPAYSLDRAFAETGLRGFVFVALCAVAPAVALGVGPTVASSRLVDATGRIVGRLETAATAFRLAIVGALATCAIAIWELMLTQTPPAASARLAIYWVDERWRWPLLLVTGVVGLSGLARLTRRGHIVPGVWFVGCASLGILGALGLPLPVWYRFLLLCQVPLAVGVAAVIADARREPRTAAIVAATFALTLGVKLATLLGTPANVSYFGQPLQPAWNLGRDIPRGHGLVATDPATAYFIPATTGRRVLTVDKGHVSSRAELARSAAGYTLLRRFYAGGDDWWTAAEQMWRLGVRYVVVAKQTTLEPRTLDDFIWQNARLRTPAQRQALGNYFYENNRIGTLVLDTPDYAVYRLMPAKLFGSDGPSS